MRFCEWRAELNKWKWVRWSDEQATSLEDAVQDGNASNGWPVPELVLLDPVGQAERGLGDCLRHRCIYVRIVSERAVQVLKNVVGDGVYFLKNRCDFGNYFAVCVTREIDAIDHKKSDIEYLSTGTIYQINRLELDLKKVAQFPIFRLTGVRGAIFVNSEFMEAVQTNNLTGFRFVCK